MELYPPFCSPTTTMSSPLPLFNLSHRVEETVFTEGELQELAATHITTANEAKIKRMNPVIVGVVESLLAHIKMSDVKERLRALVTSEPDFRKLEVPIFEYTRILLQRTGNEWLPEYGMTVKELGDSAEENEAVDSLPVPVRISLSSEDRRIPLSKVFAWDTYALPLLAHYIGDGFFIKQVMDAEPLSKFDDIYEARRVQLMLCYYPHGMPLYRRVVLDYAKKRWGLKTTHMELNGEPTWGGVGDGTY